MSAAPSPLSGAVFLSYAREDTEAARRVADALRGFGVEVWFDQSELRGGDQWDGKIKKQIRECALFVALVSQHTEERSEGYFRREWKLAVERTHDMAASVAFIVPVAIDETPERDAAVPEEFLRYQWSHLAHGVPTPQFVEQVKRLLDAPRKAGPASRLGGSTAPVVAGSRVGHRVPAVWLAAIVVLVAGGFVWRQQAVLRSTSGLNAHRIAVLPLDHFSPDAKNEYLSGAMTEELTSSLSKISGLEVIARTSSEQVKKAGKSLSQIGAELRAGTVLEGSVSKEGDQLRISVQLIDVATQRHLWSENYNTEFKDVFKMRSDVAERVAEALKVKLLGVEKQRLAKTPTANMEAYQRYQTGRYWWNKRTKTALEKAIQHFTQALELDSRYAEAQAGLSACYALGADYGLLPTRQTMPKAKAAAMKALELDASLAEPHAVLAYVQASLFDWTGAEKEYRRAIELNPNYATAHQWFSECLAYRGRVDDAINEMRRAEELDPLSLIIRAERAWLFCWKGQYDVAIQICRKGLELDPDFGVLHQWLGEAYLGKRMFPEALAEARKMRTIFSGSPRGAGFLLGYALAQSGDKAGALQVLSDLEDYRRKGLAVDMEIVYVYIGLNEIDKALDFYERAFEAGDSWPNLIDPRMQDVRQRPRGQALLRKMNLVK